MTRTLRPLVCLGALGLTAAGDRDADWAWALEKLPDLAGTQRAPEPPYGAWGERVVLWGNEGRSDDGCARLVFQGADGELSTDVRNHQGAGFIPMDPDESGVYETLVLGTSAVLLGPNRRTVRPDGGVSGSAEGGFRALGVLERVTPQGVAYGTEWPTPRVVVGWSEAMTCTDRDGVHHLDPMPYLAFADGQVRFSPVDIRTIRPDVLCPSAIRSPPPAPDAAALTADAARINAILLGEILVRPDADGPSFWTSRAACRRMLRARDADS